MIAGKLVTLRPFESRHLEKTYIWANDPEYTRLMDRAWPISDLEHQQWFSHLHERKNDLVYFAIEANETGQHLGNIWLWDIDWRHREAEISVIVGEQLESGKGIGSEAIVLVTTYAFDRLNLHRVYAHVLAINPRARRAFEKAGFVLEGTLKEDRWAGSGYVDVYLLARLSGG